MPGSSRSTATRWRSSTGCFHERAFHLFETAFDGALADDEPGAILMARVLAELAEEPDVDAFDYGFGDAQYKQSLSDASWDEVDVLAASAARPRALCLNAVTVAATYGVTHGEAGPRARACGGTASSSPREAVVGQRGGHRRRVVRLAATLLKACRGRRATCQDLARLPRRRAR